MKRDPLVIVEEIMKALEDERDALSINQISQKTGIHNITVRKYVQIIQVVKREPEIEIIKTKNSIIMRIRRQGEV